MFFNYFKDFILKKKLKKILVDAGEVTLSHKVKTIGVLVDEVSFFKTMALKKILMEKGFCESDIFILAFNNSKNNENTKEYPVFGWENMSLGGQVREKNVAVFMQQPLDVLLSYYETNNGFLQWITHQSKASFKVGFYAVDQRLNHVMINTTIDNFKQFVQEFVRVLQIINKI